MGTPHMCSVPWLLLAVACLAAQRLCLICGDPCGRLENTPSHPDSNDLQISPPPKKYFPSRKFQKSHQDQKSISVPSWL